MCANCCCEQYLIKRKRKLKTASVKKTKIPNSNTVSDHIIAGSKSVYFSVVRVFLRLI